MPSIEKRKAIDMFFGRVLAAEKGEVLDGQFPLMFISAYIELAAIFLDADLSRYRGIS